ncbi:hypothetical protein H9Q70_000531 [Fusarium xylarioides]|nr:hypothetical protein H9Q70_000531 [Fusarium xylarioides]KAG5772179.1 hypothetical protein H9Q73_012611 [Fusarium xylarioides]
MYLRSLGRLVRYVMFSILIKERHACTHSHIFSLVVRLLYRILATKLTPANSNFAPTPTYGSMLKDYIDFQQAEADENCHDILKTYKYLLQEQFSKYNIILKDNCDDLWKGSWYWVALKSEALTPPTVTAIPSHVPSGSSKNFTACVKEFIAMNPSVLDDCDDVHDYT